MFLPGNQSSYACARGASQSWLKSWFSVGQIFISSRTILTTNKRTCFSSLSRKTLRLCLACLLRALKSTRVTITVILQSIRLYLKAMPLLSGSFLSTVRIAIQMVIQVMVNLYSSLQHVNAIRFKTDVICTIWGEAQEIINLLEHLLTRMRF